MPFTKICKDYINDYVHRDMPSDEIMEEHFNYIKDLKLKDRLFAEFKSVRYMYKLFEGLEATDENLLLQVRAQIIFYVGIYEAIIHHILFELVEDEEKVKELKIIKAPIQIHIPRVKLAKLQEELKHDGKEILTYYIGEKKRDLSKIRFDEKAVVFYQLGFIDKDLRDELIQFYNIRNGIHIHAELRKEIDYEINLSKLAYWRMEKFKIHVTKELKNRNLDR